MLGAEFRKFWQTMEEGSEESRSVSRVGLRKGPLIMSRKQESTFFLSWTPLPIVRTGSVQRTCRRPPGAREPRAEDKEVWKNKAVPLGQPTRREKDTLRKASTDGWKEGSHPTCSDWFLDPQKSPCPGGHPHQNSLQ